MKKIETERLTMEIMSVRELLALAEEYRLSGPELCKAYREMAQVYEEHPGEREWYTSWRISTKDGVEVGDADFKGLGSDGRIEIGYGIREEFRRCGYATEAVGGLCGYALACPEITAVEAETAPDNEISVKVLVKNGFAPTGTFGEEGPRFIKTK